MGHSDDTRGGEVEAWISPAGQCVPAIVNDLLLGKFAAVNGSPNPFALSRESGDGAIEVISIPAVSIAQVVEHIRAFDRRVAGAGYGMTYACRSPFDVSGADTLLTQKSRFAAIVEAAQLETAALGRPNDWRRLLQQNQFAATHLHREFKGLRFDGEAVDHRLLFLTNIINSFGPRIAKIICAMCGVDNAGHLGIFDGWAAPERFSRFGMWYRSFGDLKDQMARMTRFVRLIDGDKDTGAWSADLKTPLDWSQDADVYTLGIWHLCRLRKTFRTLEIRLLPSLPIELLEPALSALDDFLTFIVGIAELDDLDIEGPEALMSRPIWKEISRFNIGSHAALPASYDAEAWLADART